MAIPDFQTLMLPVLNHLSDGAEHSTTELRECIAAQLKLTPEELSTKLKSGTGLFANRLAWAVSYLNKAKLVNNTGRGVYRISERGVDLLKQKLSKITVKTLHEYPEIKAMYKAGSDSTSAPATLKAAEATLTPEEQLDSSFQVLQDELADEVLTALSNASPSAFEHIVMDLLKQMGYGGSVEDAGEVVGKPGDGGIDGTIKQDKLGLDVVYVQAKRWQANIGSPEVMRFCGSLTAHHANKGVLITTSAFTKDATEYVAKIPQKIVLIGGKQLAELMIEHGVGVSQKKSYIVNRLDQDYFDMMA